MKGKSPLMKALIGKQENLNEGLKAAIKAAPDKMMVKSPSMMMQMKTAMKVRGMGEDAVGKVRGMGEKSAAKVMMKEKAAAKVMMKEKTPAKAVKPDFPDVDGDGDRKESISKASRDAKAAGKVMKNSALKKEGEKGKKIEYSQSTREWDSPKDLQNATSMVIAKINKAMPTPSAEKKELTAQAKKLLSTGAVGNLDKLMGRNNIAGNFTSFKGFSITPKKK